VLIGSEDANDLIDLAHTPDFSLGNVVVRPSSRGFERAGDREILEPRVMQVLVALTEANGAVVSRDDLVRRCWEGRSVGEDAINRCIAKLRRIAEADDGQTFTIETIPRVGYRLVPAEPAIAAPPPAFQAASPPAPAVKSRSAFRLRSLIAACAAFALIGVATGLAVSSLSPKKHWVVESARAIIATPLIERHPALSPDGTMIAYSAGKDVFSRQLYLRRIAGGDPIRLTDDAYDHVAPNWSRDGGRIVYVAVKQGEPCHIFVMPVPAGLTREIARCLTEERTRADWDLDGRAIYFSDRPAKDVPARIVRLDIATGRRSDLTRPPADFYGDQEPSVSPDGRLVGFLRARNEADIAVVAHEFSSGIEQTLYRGLNDLFPGWAWAENSRDIFVSNERSSVLRRHFATGQDEDLFSSPYTIGRLSRGPGGLLAAEMDTYRSNLAVPPVNAGDPPALIDPANNQTWGLSFAPDGTLAMVSNRSGEDAIWLMPPGKAASQLVVFGQTKVTSLGFSPDGQRIAVVVALQGTTAVRILSAGGTEIVSIPLSAPEIGNPQWLPDGKGLVFPMRDGKGFRIVRLDLAQPGKVTPLTEYGWIAVRLHGSEMFGVRDDKPGIWQFGESRRLVTDKLPAGRSGQWRIAADDIIYVDASDREHLRLRAKPISGGPDRVFANTPRFGDDAVNGETGEFAINPRTGQVVYTSAVQVDTDIHLLHLVQR
jgi:DNA-binding winged helix-turn-helix (wHTH) protein/Tol biopolymer transport system component